MVVGWASFLSLGASYTEDALVDCWGEAEREVLRAVVGLSFVVEAMLGDDFPGWWLSSLGLGDKIPPMAGVELAPVLLRLSLMFRLDMGGLW